MPRIATVTKAATQRHGKSHHQTGLAGFVGVDGEGTNYDPDTGKRLTNGEHRYVLLSVGRDHLEDSRGLEFTQILSFIYQHYQPRTAFVGYYLGYDFTEWFKTLPEERAHRLLTKEGRAKRARKPINGRTLSPWLVDYGGWQFDILGGK